MSDNDSRKGRNYEDLKARLGLQKTTPEPAPMPASTPAVASAASAAPVGEPPGEQTPAGGFDLGLERGGRTLDETAIDVELAAAQMVTAGGPDFAVKRTLGMRLVMAGVALAGLAGAFFVGFAVQRTQYDRVIAARQVEDGGKLYKAVTTAKTARGDQTLVEAVDAFVDTILTTDKVLQEKIRAPELTDAVLKDLEKTLLAAHKASLDFFNKGAFLEADAVIGKTVFNGDAIKEVLRYERVLKRLYYEAMMMAREDLVFNEFQSTFDPAKVAPPSKVRAWRYATVKDNAARPTGYLVEISFINDKAGKRQYRKTPIEVPEGMKIPEGQPTFTWQTYVSYQNPKQVGKDKPEDWVDNDLVVTWELKADIAEAAREQIKLHDEGYHQLMLRRLIERVATLKQAALPIRAARERVFGALAKAAGE